MPFLVCITCKRIVTGIMKNYVYSMVILLYMSVITSSTIESEFESSTLKSALLNIESVLSTEPTIFHYPRTTETSGEPKDSGNKVKRNVFDRDWADQISVVIREHSALEKYPIKHVSYRDVGGVPYPSSSPKYPPQIPSYAPPSRAGFFTPPLPPEYLNPFADKPTLRGSNSESTNQNARRPIPPPPVFRPFESNKDRVPLPPPDLLVPDNKPTGKKALNTPSRPNSHQTLDNAFKDMMNVNNNKDNARTINDTDFDFVPIMQYPSVSRILSGSSGRRHDITDVVDRHSGPNSRPHNHNHNYEHITKNLPNLRQELSLPPGFHHEIRPKPIIPDIIKPPEKIEPVNNTIIKQEDVDVSDNQDELKTPTIEVVKPIVNKTVDLVSPSPQPEPPLETQITEVGKDSNLQKIDEKNPIHFWGIAWDIHVYLIASLFTLLSLYTVYNLVVIKFYKHLLSYSYYIIVHVLVAVIGVLRAVYLFHDAYNIMHSYPEPISHLLLNIACPLITTAFSVLFLFLVKTTEVSLFHFKCFQHPVFLIIVSLVHLGMCICFDLMTDLKLNTSGTKYLPFVCQCIYIIFCVVLGGSYLYVFKNLAKIASRKQMDMFGALYTSSDSNKTRPDALCFSIRITLAAAMLILLMAVVQLYGIVGVPVHESYSFLEPHNENMQRWIWWAYQFSVRVIEISICYLIVWASTQKLQNEIDEKETNSQNSTTGFALFPCGPCRNAEETVDDIYPAVCNTNQAIHNYSLRTGKKVYDDAFPLNNIHNTEQPDNHTNTYEKRKSKRAHSNIPWHLNPNQGNNYDEIGPGSEIIEIKDALTRKGLANITHSDSDTSHHSYLPAHVSYESIGYHSGTFQRIGIENNHFEDKNDTTSEHSSNMSKNGFFDHEYDASRGSFTMGHKKLHRNSGERNSYNIKKSGTLMAFPPNDKRKLRELHKELNSGSPNSMLVDENGFVRFRSLADSERMNEEANVRRSANKKSLPRRFQSEDRASR